MARVTAPVAGSRTYHTVTFPALFIDYVSQTDANAQNIAGDLTIAGNLVVNGSFTFGAQGSVTGRVIPGTPPTPITVAHGLGYTPTKCSPGVNGAQPYAVGWTADGTNLYFYPNTTAEVTISYIAW